MRRSFSAVLAVLVLTGCNTYFKDTYQKIMIHTPGVENAECILETATNRFIVMAPGFSQVERSKHPLTVTCRKANYITGVKTIESKIRMAHSQLNVFNGFMGVPYDVASNSIYEYPSEVTIVMTVDPNAPTLPPREINVLQKKPEPVKPAPPATAPKKGEAEKAFSKGLRK